MAAPQLDILIVNHLTFHSLRVFFPIKIFMSRAPRIYHLLTRKVTWVGIVTLTEW